MNPDLAAERTNLPFNFRAVSSFLYGGEENLKRRDYIGNKRVIMYSVFQVCKISSRNYRSD